MTEREKVTKALECCLRCDCSENCPWYSTCSGWIGVLHTTLPRSLVVEAVKLLEKKKVKVKE